MIFAAGYQHFSDGMLFGDMVLAHKSVREIYFPWPEEASGRPVLGYEEEDDQEYLRDTLFYELKRLRKAGIKLDLLFNANCYGELAMSTKLTKRVNNILDELNEYELLPDIVTTTSPFIARSVKKHAPEVEVRASVNMRLMTIQAMEYLSGLFDSYYIGRDIQRNLDNVRAIRKWCDANDKKLCMLANSGCLRNCPWQTYHDNLVAHLAGVMKATNVRGWTPHLCWTMYKKASRFPEILKATWVRPEDLHHYEGLVDVVKLATRQHSNPMMVMSAYERGSFDGNLLDLFEPGFAPAFYPGFIDNTAFPKKWFENSSHCVRECTHCGYCEEVFKKVCRKFNEEDGKRKVEKEEQDGCLH